MGTKSTVEPTVHVYRYSHETDSISLQTRSVRKCWQERATNHKELEARNGNTVRYATASEYGL